MLRKQSGITRKRVCLKYSGKRRPDTVFFKEEDINRLKVIKLYRKIGIPIREIHAVINKENSLSVVLLRQIQDINNQLNDLQAKKELLESVLVKDNLQETAAEMIYDIEDIIYCNPRMVREKLADYKKHIIILASMGASPRVNDFLQELLPDIRFQEEQSKLGRVRTKDIEKAQTDLIVYLNRIQEDIN